VAGPYVAANLAASAHAALTESKVSAALLMPVVFASLHLAYGFGSLWGCVRLAVWHSQDRRRQSRESLRE